VNKQGYGDNCRYTLVDEIGILLPLKIALKFSIFYRLGYKCKVNFNLFKKDQLKFGTFSYILYFCE